MNPTKRISTRSFAVRVGVLLLIATLAFATPTPLSVVTLKQNNYAVVAGDLNVTPAAMDAGAGNSFVATGKEVLVFMNTDTATHTVTITSVTDPYGRLDTSLTTYTVPVAAGGTSGISAIEMSQTNGWTGAGSLVSMTTSSALIKIMVLRHQ
jgi:hypothetical protein